MNGRLRGYSHIYAKWETFTSYTPAGDDKKVAYFGYSQTAKVLGKSKVLLKLTLGKTFAHNDVLHVSKIWANLVSVALLDKFEVKVSFKSDKKALTKWYRSVIPKEKPHEQFPKSDSNIQKNEESLNFIGKSNKSFDKMLINDY